jgi:nucleotide-binding universal stress UspA family protein
VARIVVPLDESFLAEQSLPWAAAIARSLNDNIHLLSVYEYDEQAWELAGIDPSNAAAHVREALHEYLKRVALSPILAGLTVTTEVRAGNVATEILSASAEGESRSVIITTHGRGGFDGSGRGSVADQLVRAMTVPVLVVPPAAREAALNSIVVCLDGGPASEQAIAPARAIANATHAQVRLLSVIDPDPGWRLDKAPADALELAMRRRAEECLARVATPGDVQAVIRGKVAGAIVDYARESGCDVLVMATHGRLGKVRLDLGSIADRVVRLADRPVLLIPMTRTSG